MVFSIAGKIAANPSECSLCSSIQRSARFNAQLRRKYGPWPSRSFRKESTSIKNLRQEKKPSGGLNVSPPTGTQAGVPGGKSSSIRPLDGSAILGRFAQTIDSGMTIPRVQEDIS